MSRNAVERETGASCVLVFPSVFGLEERERENSLEYYQSFDLYSPDFWRIRSHRFGHLGHARATERHGGT